MQNILKIFILLLLIPVASATLIINNGSTLTNTTIIPINITGDITYSITVDGNVSLHNSSTAFEINSTLGYHNITVNGNESITLIYDLSPPVITIDGLSSSTYHYTQLSTPNITISDPDNLSTYILSQTPVLSYPGNHTFSVTAADEAGRHNTTTINYTVIANTTVSLTKSTSLLIPLNTTSLTFNSTSPVNLTISVPDEYGFTIPNNSFTNITSLDFTIKSGINMLDSSVDISVYYMDNYGEDGLLLAHYWLVGNLTVFYISYDSNKDAYISRQEAVNATKTYYTTSSISSDRIKEMITVYRNNQTYIK